jgi:hypothetical protein
MGREAGEGNMRFQVGKFVCELSVNEGGTVLAKWTPETPKYLNKDERAQWQAGLTTFLNSLIKDDPRPSSSVNGSTARVKNLLCLIMAAGLLAGCARGGGIGLEAMLADSTCEQQGFHLGTPEYANCRGQIAYQQGMVNAAMQAQLRRESAELTAQMNRQQTCVYNGSNIGGITGGTMTCR